MRLYVQITRVFAVIVAGTTDYIHANVCANHVETKKLFYKFYRSQGAMTVRRNERADEIIIFLLHSVDVIVERDRILPATSTKSIISTTFNHPFHIHVNSFQVMKVIKQDGTEEVFNPPLWKDTYLIKPRERLIIRSRYEDFTGDFVLHCHILDHEDQGMMELVRIAGPL